MLDSQPSCESLVGKLPKLAVLLAKLLAPQPPRVDTLADKSTKVHHKAETPVGGRMVGNGMSRGSRKALGQGAYETARQAKKRKAAGFRKLAATKVVETTATIDPVEVENWLCKLGKKKLAQMLKLSRPALFDAYKAAMRAAEVRKDTTAKAAVSPIPPYRKPKAKKKSGERPQEHQHDATLQGYPYMASPTGGCMMYAHYDNKPGYKLG